MELTHIFYKELKTDGNNVFTANISEKNEIENVIFKKTPRIYYYWSNN